VLSPGTRRLDLTDKRDIYGTSGVGHLWLVEPEDRTLEAFERRDGAWVLIAAIAGEAEVRIPPFDAVAFPLAALWTD
jgi:Uma2 family endonuclease